MAREGPPQGAADTNAEVEVSHEELYWMKWVSRNALLFPHSSFFGHHDSHVNVSGPALQ